MSKAIIITVAGTSSRFRETLGKDVLKAIYKDNNCPSILGTILSYSNNLFDDIFIVGGYKYNELEDYIQQNHSDKQINLIHNENYEKGSNLSLIMGIKALTKNYDEVLFIEGDLIIDEKSFLGITNTRDNTITYTTIPIQAKTAVAYYINEENNIIYKYDTNHNILTIEEPFKAIYNSGQVWKFCNTALLKKIANTFTLQDSYLTNLATIEEYFNNVSSLEHYQINNWYNCNTIGDYKMAMKYIGGIHNE